MREQSGNVPFVQGKSNLPSICHCERSACPACHACHACHERSVVERSVVERSVVKCSVVERRVGKAISRPSVIASEAKQSPPRQY